MKQYTKEELKQIFDNRSNCYADSDEVILAMDKDRFIEVLTELKILPHKTVTCALCGCTTDNRVKIIEHGYKHCKNCGNTWL